MAMRDRNEQSEQRLKRWHRYAIAFGVGVLFGVLFSFLRGVGTTQTAAWNARYFSDGFFIAAVLLIGMGGLVWASTTGFFDIFAYGVKSLLVLFTSLRKPKDHPSYYDFKTMRDEHRGKTKPYMLVAGLFCLVVSAVALALYYSL